MPGVRVDGRDVLAVYDATREAVARARAGEGPTFIEALSYRAAPHGTADDPRTYMDAERVEEEAQHECLAMYEGYLRRRGLLSDETVATLRTEAEDVVRAGMKEAEALPPADIGLVFETTFASPPASFADDLAELRRILGA
jgi:pyruvate dehydrogenase E1 component alpha subunit